MRQPVAAFRMAMNLWLVVSALALGAGCSAATMPSREGSTSDRVVWAYFSKEKAATRFDYVECARRGGRSAACGHSVERVDKPPRATEFDPDRDKAVHFFVEVRGPKATEQKEFEIRGELLSPSRRWAEFNRTRKIDADRGGDWTQYWQSWEFDTQPMRRFPGTWMLVLYLDGEEVGSYSFVLGDPATLAKLKEAQKQSVQLATSLLGPPQVRLDLSGPTGINIQVLQNSMAVKTGSFDVSGKLSLTLPAGTYDLEVVDPGFQPWRETITLGEQDQQVSRTVTLRAR